MSDEELKEALLGLFAFDTGCTQAKTCDEKLRTRVIEEINKGLVENQLFTTRMARIARDLWLSDEAIESGYGLEDIRVFINWLDETMRPQNEDAGE